MHAEVCPLCKGSGWKTDLTGVVCHGCNGRGWVEVNDSVAQPVYPGFPWWGIYPPPTADPYYRNPYYVVTW